MTRLIGVAAMIFCHASLSLTAWGDERPPELDASIRNLRSAFASIYYEANYTVTTYAKLKLIDPIRKTSVPELVINPTATAGKIAHLHCPQGERSIVQVTTVAPADENAQFASDSLYDQSEGTARIYLKTDGTVRIDDIAGRQMLQPRPRDLRIFSDLLTYDLADDAVTSYASVPTVLLAEQLKKNPIKTVVARVERDGKSVVRITESCEFPLLTTRVGVVKAARLIDLDQNFHGYPSRIEENQYGKTHCVYTITWTSVINPTTQEKVIFPLEVRSDLYYPRDVDDAPQPTLKQSQILTLLPARLKFDADLQDLPVQFPPNSRVYDSSKGKVGQPTTQNIAASAGNAAAPGRQGLLASALAAFLLPCLVVLRKRLTKFSHAGQ
jgi:hypothetical protein